MLSTLIRRWRYTWIDWRETEWRTNSRRAPRIAIIAVAGLWLLWCIGAVDGGHGAIDEPVGDGRLAGMRQQARQRGSRPQLHIGRLDEIIRCIIIVLRGVLHHVMPDRAGPGDTNHIDHLAVIAVSSPDSHRQVRRIAQRPVVAEFVGGAGFRRCRAIQLKRITGEELVITRLLVGEDAAHQKSHVRAHRLHAVWMRCIIVIEYLPLAIRDFQDRGLWHAYPLVCRSS